MMDASQDRQPVHPARGMIAPALVILIAYIAIRGTFLGLEFLKLREEWQRDIRGRVIGYPGVTPVFSYARGPSDWLHDEGDLTFLWAGWDRHAKKHTWFKVGKGELHRERFSHPMGRDTIRAIDKPRVETRGGEIWNNIPPENTVVVGEFLGVSLAYPLGVLDKVLIINDMILTKPLLVLYTPFVADAHAVEMFNPVIGGKRLTMGHSGYLWDQRPLLYDREYQSLWVPSKEGLKAVAGSQKGKVIDRLARLDPAPWGEWSGAHPDGRLVAGAIRPELKNLKP